LDEWDRWGQSGALAPLRIKLVRYRERSGVDKGAGMRFVVSLPL
jgi:hypothetical protein